MRRICLGYVYTCLRVCVSGRGLGLFSRVLGTGSGGGGRGQRGGGAPGLDLEAVNLGGPSGRTKKTNLSRRTTLPEAAGPVRRGLTSWLDSACSYIATFHRQHTGDPSALTPIPQDVGFWYQ